MRCQKVPMSSRKRASAPEKPSYPSDPSDDDDWESTESGLFSDGLRLVTWVLLAAPGVPARCICLVSHPGTLPARRVSAFWSLF